MHTLMYSRVKSFRRANMVDEDCACGKSIKNSNDENAINLIKKPDSTFGNSTNSNNIITLIMLQDF